MTIQKNIFVINMHNSNEKYENAEKYAQMNR
jgi:hypothetical protein